MSNHSFVSCKIDQHFSHHEKRMVTTAHVESRNLTVHCSDANIGNLVNVHLVPNDEWESLPGKIHIGNDPDFPHVWKVTSISGVQFCYHHSDSVMWLAENKQETTA